MYRLATHTILHIDNIRKNLEQFPQKLRIIRNGCSMDGRTVIKTLIMLDQVELLELIYYHEVT